MNTETMVSHGAVDLSHQGAATRQTHGCHIKKGQLLADLKVVVADAEQVIKEATDCSVEGFATLRARFERKLVDARTTVDLTRAAVIEKTRHATDATHAYVKENLWKSAGAIAVAGAIFGYLLARRSADSPVDAQVE